MAKKNNNIVLKLLVLIIIIGLISLTSFLIYYNLTPDESQIPIDSSKFKCDTHDLIRNLTFLPLESKDLYRVCPSELNITADWQRDLLYDINDELEVSGICNVDYPLACADFVSILLNYTGDDYNCIQASISSGCKYAEMSNTCNRSVTLPFESREEYNCRWT